MKPIVNKHVITAKDGPLFCEGCCRNLLLEGNLVRLRFQRSMPEPKLLPSGHRILVHATEVVYVELCEMCGLTLAEELRG